MQTKLFTLFVLLSFSASAQQVQAVVGVKDPSLPIITNPIPNKKLNHYFSLQFTGLTIHPGGGAVRMVKNYPLKLDEKAYLVLNLGLAANYDVEVSKNFFVRGAVAAFSDCAGLATGYLHVGFRWNAIKLGRHSFNLGMGPTLAVREDWHRFEDYNDGDFYGKRVWNGMQYRLFAFGGEVEYQYQFNDKWAFQYSMIPGYPAVLTSRFGLRCKL